MRRHRRGVGLVELLIALAICASLLTAVGMAVNASFDAYQINQEQSSLTQRSRLSLHRILTQIRTSREHEPYTSAKQDDFEDGINVTDVGINMFDIDGNEHTYRYDADTDQIIHRANGTDRVLMEGVTAFNIKLEPMRSDESIRIGGSHDLLKRATINLTVHTIDGVAGHSETTGTLSLSFSSSAMPRRNIW